MTTGDLEKRLRRFLDAGYRPRITPHLVSATVLEPTGVWATIMLPDGLDPDGPEVLHAHGWRVDATPVRSGQQMLVGGVFPTVEEALAYTEAELEKYR
jgi:hypothetical protein